MPNILGVLIYDRYDKLEVEEYFLSSFNFLARRLIKEIISFCSKEAYKRIDNQNITKIGLDDKNKELLKKYNFENVLCNIKKHNLKRSYCIITVDNYDTYLIDNMFTDLEDNNIFDVVTKYEELINKKSLLSVQRSIDDTKKIMIVSISQLLERGEKLDDLIDKTDEISFTTKQFKKNSSKLNSCCLIL